MTAKFCRTNKIVHGQTEDLINPSLVSEEAATGEGTTNVVFVTLDKNFFQDLHISNKEGNVTCTILF